MANTVSIQKLTDGTKKAALKIVILSDGVSGEETDTAVVDVSTLTPVPTDVVIDRICYDTTGCSAVLEWDATADTPLMLLGTDSHADFDFRPYGGVHSTAGAGETGDILITTTGLGTAGDGITLLIELSKI